MRTIEQLKSYYDTDMKDDLASLERQRYWIAFQIVAAQILIWGGAVAGAVITTIMGLTLGWIILFLLCGAAFSWVSWNFLKSNSDFHIKFKTKVIEKLLHFIDPSLHYVAYKHVSVQDFRYSSIFDAKLKSFEGDDFVWGKVGDMDIQFSELEVEAANKKNPNKKPVMIFKGLFLVAQTDTAVQSEIIVVPKTQHDNEYLNKNIPIVQMGHTEFDSMFTVRSSDEGKVKTIFTEKFMNHMIDFKKKSKHDIYFGFHGNRAYFATSLEKNLFEPHIFRTMNNFEVLREYFDDLIHAITIVEDLRLEHFNPFAALRK
jgi:hypothetical protein